MHRPRIGIPLTLDDRGRWRADREYHYIERSYADVVDRAGGVPLHLPIQQDPESLVESLDGLLLPGGDDFPSETPLPDGVRLSLVPSEQLAFDEALYDAARSRGIPILGICYGMQLMARREGARLDCHLPSQRPEAACHKLPDAGRHPIEIDRTSRLAKVLETTRCSVNSLHHQAIRELGSAYRAVAHSPDGVIEGIECEIHCTQGQVNPWQIGVQWHPEKIPEASSERLFRAFVDACRSAIENTRGDIE